MNKLSIHYNKKRFSLSQQKAVEKALQLALKVHDGQLRASGEPFIIHPIAVAEIVSAWGLDHEAIMAALLHDVVEDTTTTLEDLVVEFGPKVAELVDGVTKLRLSKTPRPAADSVRLESSNENLRKLLLATTKDYRVMLIKLADRLHNMRTLTYLPEAKRTAIARESLQVYASLADRLGMGALKGELEDLGFQYAYPHEYTELEKLVHATTKKTLHYLATLKRAMAAALRNGGVKMLSVEARQKHYYSIYKKLLKVDGDIEKIYDLIAVRVIVPDVSACYQALGIIHQHYRPLIYRIKDYIAVPKPNGYQSLHTTVFAEDGHITEIQIRTPQMHEAAEYGLAAHFFYDEQKKTAAYTKRTGVSVVPDNLSWVRQLSALQKATGGGREFVEGAALELFADRIFAFSPKGDLYEFPEGATPLDFAFAIHSDIGLRTSGVKVNGRMVPLDTRLENRDVVEVVTRREPAPSRDWLSYVVTNHAKNRIRAWFRSASREANLAQGRSELETALQVWGVKRLEDLPKRTVSDTLDALHVRSLDDLLAGVGEGVHGVNQIIHRFIPNAAKPTNASTVKRVQPTGRITTEGEQLPYMLAACCKPVFPQPLLGFVTRGKGITVHALGCRNIPVDVERYVTCRWETLAETRERLLCRVDVLAANRVGLISDLAGVVASQRFNIAGISTKHIGIKEAVMGESVVSFGVEVPDLFALAGLMRKLERLPGVIEVRRVD